MEKDRQSLAFSFFPYLKSTMARNKNVFSGDYSSIRHSGNDSILISSTGEITLLLLRTLKLQLVYTSAFKQIIGCLNHKLYNSTEIYILMPLSATVPTLKQWKTVFDVFINEENST